MNPNATYHVIDTATVNGKQLELRRLDTGNASAYLVVVNPGRRNETVANFSNKAHATAAFDMATEALFSTL